MQAYGPKSLEEALRGWATAPQPLPGFGDVQDVGSKPPKPPTVKRGRKLFDVEPPQPDKLPVPLSEIEDVAKRMKAAAQPFFDKPIEDSDFTVLAAYLDGERTTWNRIKRGGPAGFSLLLHELEEIRVRERHGAAVLQQNYSYYKIGHGFALLKEADFLLAFARLKGYNLSGIGSIVASNPLGFVDGTIQEDMVSGWKYDNDAANEAARRQGLKPVVDLASERQVARKFFAWLMEHGWNDSEIPGYSLEEPER